MLRRLAAFTLVFHDGAFSPFRRRQSVVSQVPPQVSGPWSIRNGSKAPRQTRGIKPFEELQAKENPNAVVDVVILQSRQIFTQSRDGNWKHDHR